jgi:SAM-dependent methyltransferase
VRKSQVVQRYYAKTKSVYLQSTGYQVPERYQSSFVHWGGGAEVQYIYRKFTAGLPAGSKILVVGVMGGRDFFLFKNLGFDCYALDIGPQPDIEPIIFVNVEEDLPFPDGTFDIVLIGEVLEHLEQDTKALRVIRRLLKPQGRLIVSLPFYNDWEGGHIRIHSPLSGERLLRMGGFEVMDYLERPGFVTPNPLNPFQHGISFAYYLLTGHTAYPLLTKLIGVFSWYLGHRLWLRPVRRLSRSFGGYYLCRKGDSLDYLTLNRSLYTAAVESEQLDRR